MSAIIARFSSGVVWSTSSTLASGNTTVSIGTGTGTFSQSITGLSPSTTYYFRAFATNSVGTTRSAVMFVNVAVPSARLVAWGDPSVVATAPPRRGCTVRIAVG